MNYGYTSIGRHTAIKLRCKLNAKSRARLASRFPQLLIKLQKLGRKLTRIEGALEISEMKDFTLQLKLAIKRSQLFYMREELHQLEMKELLATDEIPF